MNTNKTHVYFVPGLAAGKEIFRNISLPEDRFEIHILEWLIPEKRESIATYAKRMAARVDYVDSVLIGVSFGGVMVQEMAQYLKLRKLMIISSVKSKNEMPPRFKVMKRTGVYKLTPTSLMLSSSDLTKFSIGPRSKKRLKLYQEFLHVRDKRYLDWAIKNMVCWNRAEVDPNVIHIHGDADIIFPVKYISNCQLIEGGSHIMLLDKGSKVSGKILENLSD